MDAIDEIRRIVIKVLEATEDACGQAVEAQLPVLPNEQRLKEIQALGTLIDQAKSHCDKAETAMLKYIRSQKE